MAVLKVDLLGPLQVSVDGAAPKFETDAQRVLLAYLAVHQGAAQRRDSLAGLLSPDRPNKQALTYLRNRLAALRRVLGDKTAVPPWFDVERKQVALRVGDDIQIDIVQFEQLLAAVEAHDHRHLAGCPTCLGRLEDAVTLVRGEFLAGLNFSSDTWEEWLLAQREYIQQQVVEAMAQLCEVRLALGEWTAVLDIAQRQLRLEPWQETAHRAIMQAHYQLNDRSAALAQYEQCEKLLWEELGVDPEEETLQLKQQILDQTVAAASADNIPHNLPLQIGEFFGREAEQAQLLQQLVDPNQRLITLVGAGGMGKTRLSIEVGSQIKASFPDGVWFVPLDAVKGGAEQIKIAVGEAIGLAQDEKQLTGDQVLAILRDKRMLLIFDNSEVALDDVAFIPEWLRRAPQIAILATSREPLNFQAESVVMLDGLPIGDTGVAQEGMNAAEALFVERGRMARADFSVSPDSLPYVRQICQLVDGSPLGIGLAAAWVRRRSLVQIRDEIGRSLDFLSTRLRDIDRRHRSMRAVLETSWQLLEPEEQEILAALTVFPTTFSAEAAKEVANALLFDLDILCEKSLLQQLHESERYLMHNLVRQFAADKLGDGKTAVTLHKVDRAFIDYFFQFARSQQRNYPQLQPEWLNFAAGIVKAHDLQAWRTLLDFAQALDEPWFRQVRFVDMREGLSLALTAAKALEDQPAVASTLLRLGEIEMELNDYATAKTHLAAALEQLFQLEDDLGVAQAKYLNGRIHNEQAQDNEALALFEASKTLFDEAGNELGVAKNLNLIAVCHIKKYRDFQTARTYLEQSAALQRP
ncbi:MAG: BTAD domain-containing putative transcriptional regulator, partial [Chloroflexota bacterium]